MEIRRLNSKELLDVLFWLSTILDNLEDLSLVSMEKIKKISKKDKSILEYLISIVDKKIAENLKIKMNEWNKHYNLSLEQEAALFTRCLDENIKKNINKLTYSDYVSKNGLAYIICILADELNYIDESHELNII